MLRKWQAELFWATLVLLILLLAVWWFPGSGSTATDSFSVAYPGKKVIYQALRRLEGNVERSTSELVPRPGFRDRLLILGPARYPSADEWDAIYQDVLQGATLIFAASLRDPYVELPPFGAKIVSLRTPDGDGDAGEEKPADELGIPAAAADRKPDADKKPEEGDDFDPEDNLRLAFLLKQEVQTRLVDGVVMWRTGAQIEIDPSHSSEWETLVSLREHPQAVVRSFGAGTVLLVASDDVFTNGNLVEPEQALLAYRLIESAPPNTESYRIEPPMSWLDETLNSSGTPKVLGILFDPLFRPVTLQLLLIAVLFGWLGARRFGPALPAERDRRRSIVEHADALGILYCRAKAGAHAVKSLREYLRLELRTLCGNSFRVDDPQAVSRQTQVDEADVRELFRQLDAVAAHDETRLANASAGQLLQRLALLIDRIRREH